MASAGAEAAGPPSVLVVGGGLAGLGAALACARAGLRVRLADAAPQKPGEPWSGSAPAKGELALPLEVGQKGIWSEYPNLLGLLDELGAGGVDAALTRPTRSGFYSRSGLEVSAPIFGGLPRLPAPFGTLAYTSPFFRDVSLSARLSALPLLPRLLDALAVAPEDESTNGLDEMSAEDLFFSQGLDRELYETFLRPVLQALLFRPPSELSAFVVLRVLWCYVFKTQSSFDVRWFRGPIDKLLLQPLVAEIERLGGTVQAGTRLADLELDAAGRVTGAVLGGAGGSEAERVPVDAVVLAAGAMGTSRTLEGCGEEVRRRLGPQLFGGLREIRATDCTAVRLALDRRCEAPFGSNVLSRMDGLEETGATFFMLERLQREYFEEFIRSTEGGQRLRDSSIVAMDFYGSDRGPLGQMADAEVVDFAVSLLRTAEPRAFAGARPMPGVRATVLRGRNAATHFAPGSRQHRPRQQTGLQNLFLAGDYIKGLDHGAEGLSQERALVSGFTAANLAMGFLEEAAPRGGPWNRQRVRQLAEDEPQIAQLRALWQRLR